MKKKTKEQFIAQVKERHGARYDYSKVNYVNGATKVEILCSDHGSFFQTPENHLSGKGCAECYGRKLKTKDKFIADAILVHGSKYDYSKVIYTDSYKTKVTIVCPEHGEFEQKPNNHLTGRGCAKCSNNNFLKSGEQFIAEAKVIHGEKYDYSLVEYRNNKRKVKIVCPKHGVFEKEPINHLRDSGCPDCTHTISKISTKWLNEINVPFREKSFKFKNETRKRQVDGYDPNTKTIYQFHGVFWHGHPDKFDCHIKHPVKKSKTFGEVYEETLRRDQNIRDSGYNLIVCWEHELAGDRECPI